jgi:ribosomal protein S18 acetylase RimI-like enzyme
MIWLMVAKMLTITDTLVLMLHKERALFKPPIIRAAKPSDMDAMMGLLQQLYQEEGSDSVQDAEALHKALFDLKAPMRLRALVAQCDNKIVGLLLYYSGYDTSSATFGFHLADVIVHKQSRRHGIGRSLFSHMTTQCVSEKGAWISLTVLHKNAAARAFYQSLGFTKVKVDFYNMGLSKMMLHAPVLMRQTVGMTN